MGFGTVVLVVNASLLWLYSLSCHSCRHIIGGRLKHFSRHPIRFKAWGVVSKLNARHMQIAWVSLIVRGPRRPLCPAGRVRLDHRSSILLRGARC